MVIPIEDIAGKLECYDERKQEAYDAKMDMKAAEADLRAAIVTDVYLCEYVMTISYPKLRRAIEGRR